MNKDNLAKLLNLVAELANVKGNEWFWQELIGRLTATDKDQKLPINLVSDIKEDTNKIVGYLEINPSCSIDYSYIHHKLLRTRLELDNLRMENIRYNSLVLFSSSANTLHTSTSSLTC